MHKLNKEGATEKEEIIIDSYQYISDEVPITIRVIKKKEDFVMFYDVSIFLLSKNTEIIIEKVRQEVIKIVDFTMEDVLDTKRTDIVEKRFREAICILVKKYFPDVDEKTSKFLINYLVQKSLGLGTVEILLNDDQLEEVAINRAEEPIWVYHRKYGWLKTNIKINNEDQIKYFAAMIGRKVGRQINILTPMMDANLATGDRVNATLMPVSTEGNTITLRKFAAKPWTITDFIATKTISADCAALIWQCVQYELSALISGGTATGKTSALNVIANFFPPNQRIISIEDTREIQLPKFLHWVPMLTRLPNPEGKGEVSMLDLLVNSLRMRPDRLIVGEIRKKREAEVLFEAIHTGHSVYATVHANDTRETITRLTNPPIDIPKTMLPSIPLIITQYRNRRTGIRRTFQIAEIAEDSQPTILYQLDMKRDFLLKINKSSVLNNTIRILTGMSNNEIRADLNEKVRILKWLVKKKTNTINEVGKIIAEYYTNKQGLLNRVKK